jgi:DNA invertase Pin-like site-specific DNA recombinase
MTNQRCAIYSRYSDHEQDGSSTIESQIRECRTYARAHGFTIVEEAVYIDRARTGTTTEQREAFQAMIAAAQHMPRPFDTVLVWKYSRFARNREDSALYKALLRRRGVQVLSVSEPVDHHSATGALTEAMIEAIDAFYSARLAEEVKRGQTQTALDGYSTGGRPPFGYRRREIPDALGRVNRYGEPIVRVTLEIEPAEAAIVLRIFEWYAAGWGYTRIAKTLNGEGIPGPLGGTWDTSTIREILKNDAYRGARAYGRIKKIRTATGTRSKRPRPRKEWTVKEGTHPGIIATDLWERVQHRRDAIAAALRETGLLGVTRRTQTRYLLTGILTCAEYGANFIVRAVQNTRFGKYRYYGCAWHSRRGDTVCTNRTLLPQAVIEAELLEILQQQLLTAAVLTRVLAAANAKLRAQAAAARPRVKELRRALTQVEREITNYRRAVARGNFKSLDTALGAAEQRQTTLQAELGRLDGNPQQAVVQLTPAALDQHLQGLTEKLRSGVSGKVREVIQQAVARILVGVDGSLTIEAKPGGLLGLDGNISQVDGQEGRNLLEHGIVSPAGRQWRVTTVE